MFQNTVISMTAMFISLGIAVATPAIAQSSAGTPQPSTVSQHHKVMYGIMKDMSQEMGKMTEQMAGGELTAEQKKQMAQRMNRMSTMMSRMSGLQARPAMTEPEMQKQMQQMRKQMDDMMGDAHMKHEGK